MPDYPEIPREVQYRGETLKLIKVTPLAKIHGKPVRLEYERPNGDRIFRYDFGSGVDWEMGWEQDKNPTPNSLSPAARQRIQGIKRFLKEKAEASGSQAFIRFVKQFDKD